MRKNFVKCWIFFINIVFFAGFALFSAIFSLVWFNLFPLFVHGRKRVLLARKSIHKSFILFWKAASFLRFMDSFISSEDKALLNGDKGTIIIANHPTYVDFLLLASYMPYVDCLIKASLLKKPTIRSMIKRADYLLNTEGDALVSECRRRLEAGDNIIIFPEGTRTKNGEKVHFKHGFSRIAIECGCPLRLVSIECSERLLDKESKWYNTPSGRPKFHVRVHDLISPSTINTLTADSASPAIAARRLSSYLENRCNQYLDRA